MPLISSRLTLHRAFIWVGVYTSKSRYLHLGKGSHRAPIGLNLNGDLIVNVLPLL